MKSRYRRYDLSALDKDIDCRRYAIFILGMEPNGKPYEVQAGQMNAVLGTDKPIAFPCPSRTHRLAGEGDYTHFYVYPHYAICYSGKCNLHEYDGEEKWLRPGKGNTIDWKTLGYLYKRNVQSIDPQKIFLGDIAREAAWAAGGAGLYELSGEGEEKPYFPYTYEEMELVGLIHHVQPDAAGAAKAAPAISSIEELRGWYFSDKESFENYLREKCVQAFIRIEDICPDTEPRTTEEYAFQEKLLHDKNLLYGISEKMGLTHEKPRIKYW